MAAPLEGVRVLDFSTLLPGPMATLILAEAGLAPERFELEVTESLLISNPEHVERQLAALKASLAPRAKSIWTSPRARAQAPLSRSWVGLAGATRQSRRKSPVRLGAGATAGATGLPKRGGAALAWALLLSSHRA